MPEMMKTSQSPRQLELEDERNEVRRNAIPCKFCHGRRSILATLQSDADSQSVGRSVGRSVARHPFLPLPEAPLQPMQQSDQRSRGCKVQGAEWSKRRRVIVQDFAPLHCSGWHHKGVKTITIKFCLLHGLDLSRSIGQFG